MALLETITERYLENEWLHVCTDGSATDSRKNAGAGVFCKQFEISAPFGKVATSFDGEINTVILAVQWVACQQVPRAVLFIDFQASQSGSQTI